VPKYKIVAHRKVYKSLIEVSDPSLKKSLKEHIAKLEDYPLSLREMDAEVIRGVKNTFRLRIGGYRVLFFVDKTEGTIYVTDIKARKKAYK
jgi:mRNA interferase RelE/StbE